MIFRAAAAEIEITPPIGLPMDGYMTRHQNNTGTHDPLMGQILVLEDGQNRAAIVALDVLAVSAAAADPIRRALAEITGTTPAAILVCPSHTHAGPAGLQRWFPVGDAPEVSMELVAALVQRLKEATHTAVSAMQPARLRYAVGNVEGIGGDRNQPRSASDPAVTVWTIEGEDGAPIAVVFHYACHPTVLGPQLAYSADFPGAARAYLRQQLGENLPGAVYMYLNGAAGNISTRFYRRAQTFDEVARLGMLLGERVAALLQVAERCEAVPLRASAVEVDLPVRHIPDNASYAFAASGNVRIDQTKAEGAAIEAQLARAFKGRNAIRATLAALQLGPWWLCGVPGEPFNELADALRQKSPFSLVIGYANDYLGYFPTQAAIDAQTYEALSSPYDARAHAIIQNTLENVMGS
jgi:hypothetical protein